MRQNAVHQNARKDINRKKKLEEVESLVGGNPGKEN
jgi:hypothetical protein